jgi:hypothetical protein
VEYWVYGQREELANMLGLFASAGYMLIVGAVLFFGVAIVRLVSAVTKDMPKTHEGNAGAALSWLGGAMVFVATVAFACIIMMGIETLSVDAWGEYTHAISSCRRVVVGGVVGGTLLIVLGAVLCQRGRRASR